jgi:hypothetical protein
MLTFAFIAYLSFAATPRADDPAAWVGALASCYTSRIDQVRAAEKVPLSAKRASVEAQRIVASCRQHVPVDLFNAKELRAMDVDDRSHISRRLRAPLH